jgi:uncharacterized protein (DUF2141 family)
VSFRGGVYKTFLNVSLAEGAMGNEGVTTREYMVVSMVKEPERWRYMQARSLIWFAVLVFAMFPAIAFAEFPCPGIHIEILNIKNSTGSVACALFESSVGFPTEYLRYATNIMSIKVRDKQARCDFQNIPPGTYALAVIHDENMNGKLDTKFIGIPKEGYGFSNDATALLGAPSFSAASFSYDGQDLDLTISLHY